MCCNEWGHSEEKQLHYQEHLQSCVENHGAQTVVYIAEARFDARLECVCGKIVRAAGHGVLFLPRSSPDLNVIEHDFSALKRGRIYAGPDTSLNEIIRNYCAA
ncbi:transposase [Thermosynechococcus sp.]|uniref:transposase n=1 Tax=Thermosynechococcus sp. TaxID=2814275 RepID=UPI00391B06FF